MNLSVAFLLLLCTRSFGIRHVKQSRLHSQGAIAGIEASEKQQDALSHIDTDVDDTGVDTEAGGCSRQRRYAVHERYNQFREECSKHNEHHYCQCKFASVWKIWVDENGCASHIIKNATERVKENRVHCGECTPHLIVQAAKDWKNDVKVCTNGKDFKLSECKCVYASGVLNWAVESQCEDGMMRELVADVEKLQEKERCRCSLKDQRKFVDELENQINICQSGSRTDSQRSDCGCGHAHDALEWAKEERCNSHVKERIEGYIQRMCQ